MTNSYLEPTNPEELIIAGSHFGHKSYRLNPRFRKYVYKIEKGIAIIDSIKTAEELDRARECVFNLGKEKKQLLVVATKKQVKSLLLDLLKERNVFFLTNKWIGGFLTNFEEISKNIRYLKKLKKERDEGGWTQFVKHERTKLEKKLRAMKRIYEGVEEMISLPDALFIIDSKHEGVAVAEAIRMHIKTVALIDTNGNPDIIDCPIPANDDAVASVQYIVTQIITAYDRGRKSKTEEINIKH
ncbi:MAG TPA: 30S ribosomal protein S2 [Patescibacteria group bacterium]|nr:30S ribosomal protein S2 [Patescibacteria group bacterium]